MLLIRAAAPEDYPAFARLFPQLHTDDPTPSEERFASALLATTLVAEREGKVVGYGFYELLNSLCYVRNLVTDPATRRAGVGRALLSRMIETGRSAGATRLCLNVKPDNAAAIALYESVGLRGVREGRALRLPWSLIDALPDAPPAPALPAEEQGAFEAHFAIEPGLLAVRRGRGGLVFGSRDAEGPTAVGCFDPAFPGGYPLRANGLAELAGVLRAMRDARIPIVDGGSWRESELQIFVEEPPELIEALLRAGARPILRVLHMAGPL